jgi:hypothetical protein
MSPPAWRLTFKKKFAAKKIGEKHLASWVDFPPQVEQPLLDRENLTYTASLRKISSRPA